MAEVYASATSPELTTRTWMEVMAAYASKSANGSRERVERAIHRAYASQTKVLPLEHYEMLQANKIIEFQKNLNPDAVSPAAANRGYCPPVRASLIACPTE